MRKFTYITKNGRPDAFGHFDIAIKIYDVDNNKYLGEIIYNSISNKGTDSEVMRFLMDRSLITIDASQNLEGNYYDPYNEYYSIKQEKI